jgi:hypothetical protein
VLDLLFDICIDDLFYLILQRILFENVKSFSKSYLN